eukprot:COSAG02_NODE_5870_length_3974_cov_5.840774_5_plen_167_part_00
MLTLRQLCTPRYHRLRRLSQLPMAVFSPSIWRQAARPPQAEYVGVPNSPDEQAQAVNQDVDRAQAFDAGAQLASESAAVVRVITPGSEQDEEGNGDAEPQPAPNEVAEGWQFADAEADTTPPEGERADTINPPAEQDEQMGHAADPDPQPQPEPDQERCSSKGQSV